MAKRVTTQLVDDIDGSVIDDESGETIEFAVNGVEYVIAVPHNIIGPRQKFDDPYRNVAAIMINLMLQGRQPFIYGDGEQKRCFSYIDDDIYCLKEMATRKNVAGHVINIGSIAGRWVYPAGNVYNATKFAVHALNEAMSIDLAGTNIRVSSIDPGAVETEFALVRFHGDEERAKKIYQGYTPLTPDDVADAVCYVANAPPHVNVLQLVMMCTDQRSATVFHKEGL